MADPLERLKAIDDSAAAGQGMMGSVKARDAHRLPVARRAWLLSGLASLYGRSRLANLLPPLANVVISNVPGPQTQLYFAGAKMISYYPVSIPAHGMALNITVESYNGSLDYGLTASAAGALPARLYAVIAGSAEHSTVLRLQAAAAAGTLSSATAGDLIDAYRFLTDLRLRHQIQQADENVPADNRVFSDRLTTDQRTTLRTAMRTVHAIQE